MLTPAWFICMIAATSAFTLGLRAITQEDKLFGFLREWFLRTKTKKVDILIPQEGMQSKRGTTTIKVPLVKEWIHQPLLTCVTCMPSVWGIIIILVSTFVFHKEEYSIYVTVPQMLLSIAFVCISSSFITELLWSLKQKLQGRL